MPVTIKKYTPITRTDIGATTVTEIVPGEAGLAAVWVSSTTALWLCYGFADGAALPTAARFLVPANVAWPVEFAGGRPSVTSSSGTASVSFLGVS